MRRALIGHTGFVGSNLAARETFTDTYNSTNIDAIEGQRFDEVVCAGVPAVKWLANREPQRDWANISKLLAHLSTIDAKLFTLISTIDVYPDPTQAHDERYNLNGIENHAYGTHRLAIERFVEQTFDSVLIVRLPALFGPGLKKNVIFDLVHGHETRKINPASSFQWYPVHRLHEDLARCRSAALKLVNLFTEPLPTSVLIKDFFPGSHVGAASLPAPCYALRTIHASVFGGIDDYVMSADQVLGYLRNYIRKARIERAR